MEVETERDRKIIVTGRKEPTIIPKSAEFRAGFESRLGVIDQDITKGLGGRFQQFKAIGTKDIPIISEVSKKAGRKITDIEILTETKIQPKVEKVGKALVPISFFEIQRAVTKVRLEQLEGKEGKVAAAQRTALQLEEFSLGIPGGGFKQFREQPIQSGLIFIGGGVASKLVTIVGKIPVASKILGAAFVAGVGAEAGIKLSMGDFGGAGEVIGERVTEAGLFIGGTQLGGTISQRISPKQIQVLKVKGRTGEFAERLRLEPEKGGTTETLQRLKFETEFKTQKLQTDVKGFTRKISAKSGKTVANLLGREDVRFEFRFADTGVKQVLVQDVPGKIRVFKTPTADPFKISVDGRIGVKVGDSLLVKDVKGVTRIIDPLDFKITTDKGFTTLQRITTDPSGLPGFKLRAELGGKATVTENLRRITANIFGVGLLPSQTVVGPDPLSVGVSSGQVLGVAPLITPLPILVPPLNITSVIESLGRVRDKDRIIDIASKRTTGQAQRIDRARIQRQKPISDVKKLIDTIQGVSPVQAPIIDVRRIQDRTPISDVISGLRQEQIRDFDKPFPKPEIPTLKEPPPLGGLFIPLPKLELFDERIKRKRKPLPKDFAFTPDFISSVLNEFGPAPRQRRFTGQERRFRVKGRRFVSPLPERETEGIFGLLRKQLEA